MRTEFEKEFIWKIIWRCHAGWDHTLLKFLQWENVTPRILTLGLKRF